MATNKPTKPTNEFLPSGFGTADGVVKNDFSTTKKLNGFSSNVEDILQGDNLNYSLDTIGKQLKYLTVVVDFLNSIGTNKIPYINSNNQFDFGDINTFLPSQSGNSGKYLTTNGTSCSWANDFIKIGDPQFTLNFTQTLPDNCVWLEGDVKSTTGDWAELFSIYGWQYDTSYTNTSQFRLPNFLNRSIWGGTTAGYIEAGLPNVTGRFSGVGQYYGNIPNTVTGAFYRYNTTNKPMEGAVVGNDGQKDDVFGFDASRSNNIFGKSNTVQPPVIKVRVYTRYK